MPKKKAGKLFENPFVIIGLAIGFGAISSIIMLSQRTVKPTVEAPLPPPMTRDDSDFRQQSRGVVNGASAGDREVTAPKKATPNAAVVSDEAAAPPLPAATKVITNEEKKQLTLVLPSVKDVRYEVSKDPHNTPPSLIRFASDMGTKMELASRSESTAHFFFGQLEKCVLAGGRHGVTPMQALCLSDAQTLGGKFDSLGEASRRLFLRADPEAVKISRLLLQ